jgi:hypothetical protein
MRAQQPQGAEIVHTDAIDGQTDATAGQRGSASCKTQQLLRLQLPQTAHRVICIKLHRAKSSNRAVTSGSFTIYSYSTCLTCAWCELPLSCCWYCSLGSIIALVLALPLLPKPLSLMLLVSLGVAVLVLVLLPLLLGMSIAAVALWLSQISHACSYVHSLQHDSIR